MMSTSQNHDNPENSTPVASSEADDRQELLSRRITPTKARRKAKAGHGAVAVGAQHEKFHRSEVLHVCRESDEYDYLLLEKMIQQVLNRGPDRRA